MSIFRSCLTWQLFLVLITFEHGAFAFTYSAASKGMHLRRRDTSLEPRHEEHSLVYAYYSTDNDILPYSAAKVSFRPRLPTLILEDTVAHDADIRCSETQIDLQFRDLESMISVRNTWMQAPEFILITSASACAVEGEHAAYIVQAPTNVLDSHSITVKATKTNIKNCTDKLEFDLGDHLVNHVEPRTYQRLVQRQVVSSSFTIDESLSSVSLPAPAPTATGASSEGDIGFARKDVTLFPPDSSIVDFVPALQNLEGLTLRCKDCTLAGKLQLQAAGFSVDTNAVDAVTDFFQEGFFQFGATGMAATMEFEFDFAPGFALIDLAFVPQLPSIPLIPIGIAGLVTYGPELRLEFPFTIKLNSPVKYSTGFTFTVPDDSKIVLNLTDIESSYSTGFQDATMDALPWDVNAPDFSLTFSAGFRPNLLMTAGLGDPDASLGVTGSAGFFLDIPSYSAVVTAVQNKSENCKDPSPANEKNTRIHIEPSEAFRAGVRFELDFSAGAVGINEFNITPLIEVVRPLPEECLLFDSETNAIVQTNKDGGGDINAAAIVHFSDSVAGLGLAAALFILL